MRYFCIFCFLSLMIPACAKSSADVNVAEAAKTPSTSYSQSETRATPSSDFNSLIPTNVQDVLANASEIEILTLDPKRQGGEVEKLFVGGRPVWGNLKTTVRDEQLRKEMIDAFYSDVNFYSGNSHACFSPHHTIKAKSNGQFVAIAVCFKCGNFSGSISSHGFGDSEPFSKRSGSSFGGEIRFKEQSRSFPIFDRLTNEFGVELEGK